VIIVDEPTKGVLYGSTVAAPYVADVMETILPYLGVEAVYSDHELEKLTVTVPGCLNQTGSYARRVCENTYGLKVIVVGDENDVVYKQFPEKGTVIERTGAKVILYTEKNSEETTVKVPDVEGLSAAAANQVLINAGLNIRVSGTKNYTGSGVKVTAQSLPAGALVPRGTVVEITVLYLGGDDIGIDIN
jgi:stage V sporulation protein D (sporulation-specific penicillin-binding protein)